MDLIRDPLWQFVGAAFALVAIIVTFVATMLGVIVAFWLNDLWHQHSRDQIAEYRLHLAILESQYNGTIALEALEVYSAANSVILFIKHVDTTAARTAFEDDNLFRFLPPQKVSLVRSYIESMDTLNRSLDIYKDYILNTRFKEDTQQYEILDNVRNNCAAAVAICIVLRESLNDYFDPEVYQHEQMRRQEERLKEIKEKVLRGEVKPSKSK